jgi:hypothetical protein
VCCQHSSRSSANADAQTSHQSPFRLLVQGGSVLYLLTYKQHSSRNRNQEPQCCGDNHVNLHACLLELGELSCCTPRVARWFGPPRVFHASVVAVPVRGCIITVEEFDIPVYVLDCGIVSCLVQSMSMLAAFCFVYYRNLGSDLFCGVFQIRFYFAYLVYFYV